MLLETTKKLIELLFDSYIINNTDPCYITRKVV